MAQNFIQPGGVIPITAPVGGYKSQDVVEVGSLVGIALGTAAEGETCEVALEGIWEITKAAGEAWAVGDKLYFSAENKNFTKTATSNTLSGYAPEAALSAAVVGKILLKQIA